VLLLKSLGEWVYFMDTCMLDTVRTEELEYGSVHTLWLPALPVGCRRNAESKFEVMKSVRFFIN
jgi:hypothetical protein